MGPASMDTPYNSQPLYNRHYIYRDQIQHKAKPSAVFDLKTRAQVQYISYSRHKVQ